MIIYAVEGFLLFECQRRQSREASNGEVLPKLSVR